MQCYCSKNAKNKKQKPFFGHWCEHLYMSSSVVWCQVFFSERKKEKKIVLLTSSLCFIVYKLFYFKKNVDNQTVFWRKTPTLSGKTC